MSLGMLILYLKEGDENYFYGHLEDSEKAQEYNNLALSEILSNKTIFDMLTERHKKAIKLEEESNINEKVSENKTEETHAEANEEIYIDSSQITKSLDGGKTTREKRIERREKRKKERQKDNDGDK